MTYTIATVSDQVQSNFIAWSIPIEAYNDLKVAQIRAGEIWQNMQKEFEARPDFGNGAIIGESIIIHDGVQTF